MDAEHRKYIREVFTLLNGEIQAGRYERANQFLDKMLAYQQTFGQRSLPSATRVQAEHIYNRVPFATILFMVCLTIGIVAFALQLFGRRLPAQRWLLAVVFLALTCCLALRWIVTSHVPMANGYETMLFLAWAVMLLAFAASRRFPIMLTFGFLLSGFFLLVSHISQMDPQMTHLMPVLNSPLLTLHVSIIMMAFALLALTFATSLTALCTKRQAAQLQLLSLLLLYPALTCLGFGIFIGAIWANVSWGTYWSWDPKETWALITFMVYAAPAHRSLSAKPMHYHAYMTFAFLTLLMTYFGVNYFLGGMHSYA
jgi:ABC-type transport system involved in cytochrome c biogenesis permease subunit